MRIVSEKESVPWHSDRQSETVSPKSEFAREPCTKCASTPFSNSSFLNLIDDREIKLPQQRISDLFYSNVQPSTMELSNYKMQ